MLSILNEIDPYFVASAVCFVWDTKPELPTIGIRARFSYYVCITCDWVLEFKKIVIFVFSNFCIKLLFHKPCVHWSIYVIYCFAWFQEDTAETFFFVPYVFWCLYSSRTPFPHLANGFTFHGANLLNKRYNILHNLLSMLLALEFICHDLYMWHIDWILSLAINF